jgi:uncharacterized membrane protein YcaP (DUF421 family)
VDLVLRTVFVYVLIVVITRAVGRRELGTMQPFDLILLVVMGDLVQQGITQTDNSATGALIVITPLAVLTVTTAYLGFRFNRVRPILEGQPVVIVQDGRILRDNLRAQRMTVDELDSEARINQIASLDDVRYAVLETNGQVSFVTTS